MGCGMDDETVLQAYDDQVRRRPVPDSASGQVERMSTVVRLLDSGDGWTGITWSDLNVSNANEAIAAQVARFAR